jgi:hypothetical protein
VKLVGRAFYDDITKGDNQPKTGLIDNRGITVVVLDALSRFGMLILLVFRIMETCFLLVGNVLV